MHLLTGIVAAEVAAAVSSTGGADGPQLAESSEQWAEELAARDRDHGQLLPGVLEYWELLDPDEVCWYPGCIPDRAVTPAVWREGRPWTMDQACAEWGKRAQETFGAQAARRAAIHAELWPGEGSQGGGAAAAALVSISTGAPTTLTSTPPTSPAKAPAQRRTGRTPRKSPRHAVPKSPRGKEQDTHGRGLRTPYSGTAPGPALHRSLRDKCCVCWRDPHGDPTTCKECKNNVCAPPHPCCVPRRSHDDLLEPKWNSSRCAG